MAARAITKAELDQVAEIHEALRNLAVGWDDPAFDWARFGALSRQFHLAVLRACRNVVLVQLNQNVLDSLAVVEHSSPAGGADSREAVTQHLAMLEALRLGDAAAAESITREHLHLLLDFRLRSIAIG